MIKKFLKRFYFAQLKQLHHISGNFWRNFCKNLVQSYRFNINEQILFTDKRGRGMKKIGLFCLAILLGFPSLLRAETKPIDLLNAMTQAHKKTNYELRYVIFQNDDLESFQYRHLFQHDKEYGQLLRLDNADEEIILRDGGVSDWGY